MNTIYGIFICVAALMAICMWLLVKCVKLHIDKKRGEILEDLGFMKNGLAAIVEKGKEVEDLCERLKRHDNAPRPIDIRDVEFAPPGTVLSDIEEVSQRDIDKVFADKPSASLSIEDIEAAFEAGTFAESYKSAYLHQPDKRFKASLGKYVAIRPEFHWQIQKILHAANAECATISGFIDNILFEHFSINAIGIEETLNPSNKRV